MNALTGVLAAAAEVQAFCKNKAWPFCFIGGIAVQRWGMPRFTQDVDLTLFTGLEREIVFIDALLEQFPGRIPNTRQFAVDHRVLLARNVSGVPIDVALGAFPFEEASIARASLWQVNDLTSLTTCSAEDLILHKVFAARDRDWADVESIIVRQRKHLNLAHIRKELPPLLELKDDAESFAKLERMIATIDKRMK